MQVYNCANDHDVHYLVAVAPVVEAAWDEALGDLYDVDHPSQDGQRVHDDEEAQGVGAAHPAAIHPEEEEAESEQELPEEGSQAEDISASRGGAVDAVGRQEDVGQQGSVTGDGVAEEGDVDDGESS